MTLGDLLKRRTREHPHRTALIVGGAEISYEELYSASARLACWLLRQGLRPGDRMAIHWHNSFEAAILYFAAFQTGIIAVPVNLRLKAPEIAYWDAVFARLAQTPEWKKDTEEQFWNADYLLSAALRKQLELENEQTRVILTELGLAKQ